MLLTPEISVNCTQCGGRFFGYPLENNQRICPRCVTVNRINQEIEDRFGAIIRRHERYKELKLDWSKIGF